MSPLAILVVALAVVIGGVLRFRWHAFLVLVVGALAVAALTPRTSILRFELGRETVTLHVLSADRKRGEVVDPKGVLEQGTRHPIFRLQAGEPPRRIGEAVLGDPGASERPGRGRAVEIVSTAPGESPRPGDAIVPAGAAKTAVRTAGHSLGQRVAEGFGKTALDSGILIAMASILGTCLMEARGAEAIVAAVQRVVGVARTSWVFLGTGFLLGIPMFAEAVFYVLLPLAKATWRTTRRRYVLSVLAIVAGATMTHSLVPPTPGPLFVANALGVSMPAMMLHGMLVGAVAAMAGYAYAVWADRRWPIPLREPSGPPSAPESGHADPAATGRAETLPPVLPSLVPILLPVLLISAAAAMESGHGGSLPAGLVALVRVVGDKNLALTISAGLAVALLTWRRRTEPGAVRSAIRSAVVEA
ncbi:MAG: GntP family permease, partial [Verrucomicrobiales bacterium]|nr:GntP family permease [Verrucomicrobiales bacterium]